MSSHPSSHPGSHSSVMAMRKADIIKCRLEIEHDVPGFVQQIKDDSQKDAWMKF